MRIKPLYENLGDVVPLVGKRAQGGQGVEFLVIFVDEAFVFLCVGVDEIVAEEIDVHRFEHLDVEIVVCDDGFWDNP